jgi:hypothetical protein
MLFCWAPPRRFPPPFLPVFFILGCPFSPPPFSTDFVTAFFLSLFCGADESEVVRWRADDRNDFAEAADDEPTPTEAFLTFAFPAGVFFMLRSFQIYQSHFLKIYSFLKAYKNCLLKQIHHYCLVFKHKSLSIGKIAYFFLLVSVTASLLPLEIGRK